MVGRLAHQGVGGGVDQALRDRRRHVGVSGDLRDHRGQVLALQAVKAAGQRLQEMKERGEKISMTTAYDYPTACMVEQAGIEIILVGDSLMMTVLGDDSTVACTMDQMVNPAATSSKA